MRLLVLLPLAACGYTVSSECVEVATTEMEDDEVSALGVSPAELLAVTAGERVVPGYLGAEGSRAPAVDVAVEVTRGEGPASFTRVEVVEDRALNGALWGETTYNLALICNDELVVPIVLAVTTSDGSVQFEEAGEAHTSSGTIDSVGVDVLLPVAEAEGLPAADASMEEAFAQANFSAEDTLGSVGWSGPSDHEVVVRWEE